jgi:putative transposase
MPGYMHSVMDHATHGAVAMVPEHSIGGEHLTRMLDAICAQRAKLGVIRLNNGKEFEGRAMIDWAIAWAWRSKLI